MPKCVFSHLCGSCWSVSTQLSGDRQAHVSAQRPVPSSPPCSAPSGASQPHREWCGAVVGTARKPSPPQASVRHPSGVPGTHSEGTSGRPQLAVATKSPPLNGLGVSLAFVQLWLVTQGLL